MRDESFKTDTKHQLLVNSWIKDLGIGTEMEKEFGSYFVDIFIPDLELGIEIDGPQHMKKRDSKRDDYITSNHNIDIWRIAIKDMTAGYKQRFIDRIMKRVEELDN